MRPAANARGVCGVVPLSHSTRIENKHREVPDGQAPHTKATQNWGFGEVFPTKCWRNDTMNFRGGIEFSFEPHLNEQIWARHNKIGLGAPKLYCFTRDKVLIAGFYTVYSAVLDCKAGLNIVVLLLCCCKFCEHQTCVTARANLIIFQLSHQIPTAPTQNVHSNEYHSTGEVINPLTFNSAWLLNRDPYNGNGSL